METNQLQATVSLINQKVKFSGKVRNNPEVIVDYTPPVGDGEGYTSLELFLVSLASCAGTAVISIARKMQKNVSSFSVHASGTRRKEHPTCFERIQLEFYVKADNVSLEELQKILNLAEPICPVWAMIKNNVPVQTCIELAEYSPKNSLA